MPRVPIAVVLAAATLSWPGMASAQQDGVTYDPDSPAGSEYRLPLDRARSEAAGPPAGPGGQSGKPGAPAAGAPATPLFGAGVSKARASGSGSRESNPPAAPGGSQEPGSDAIASERPEVISRERIASADGASSLALGGLIALACAGVALLAGLGLRRRRALPS